MFNDNITDKDITIACNLIKRSRENNKKTKQKCITIQLFKENDHAVSSVLNISIRFDNPSFAHCVRYCRKSIYPTVNNKLRCINKAGLLMLKKHRDSVKKIYHRKEFIRFYESLQKNPHVGLSESIYCNKDNVVYSSYFDSKEKLLFIDVE